MTSGTSLRERQAAVIREAILDGLVALLDRHDPDDIAMSAVAADAGISLRTLYRYFPTREAMFDAVGDHVVARLGLPRQIEGADDISRVFLESASRGAQSPQLVRAMLWTRLGRRARSSHRGRRVESITGALAEVTSHLPPAEARRREGAIVYLASLPAWITVSEECGLSAEDARLGIAWAIRTLIGELRRENQRAGEPPSQPKGRTP
ncbi:MAG TPA: helix-turn-helix domain-containing protein [Streptosporangiaceae bacterium]|nr:helix-turn-helix domain-containing protein [Streptosporangiaceae bacterium]